MHKLLIPWDGKLYRSNLTEGLYRLSRVERSMALLESVDAMTREPDGRSMIVTEEGNLELFYSRLDGNGFRRAGIR